MQGPVVWQEIGSTVGHGVNVAVVADGPQLSVSLVSTMHTKQAPLTDAARGIQTVARVKGEQVVVVGPAGSAVLAPDVTPRFTALKQFDGLARRQLRDDGIVGGGTFPQTQGDVGDLQPCRFGFLALGGCGAEEQCKDK